MASVDPKLDDARQALLGLLNARGNVVAGSVAELRGRLIKAEREWAFFSMLGTPRSIEFAFPHLVRGQTLSMNYRSAFTELTEVSREARSREAKSAAEQAKGTQDQVSVAVKQLDAQKSQLDLMVQQSAIEMRPYLAPEADLAVTVAVSGRGVTTDFVEVTVHVLNSGRTAVKFRALKGLLNGLTSPDDATETVLFPGRRIDHRFHFDLPPTTRVAALDRAQGSFRIEYHALGVPAPTYFYAREFELNLQTLHVKFMKEDAN